MENITKDLFNDKISNFDNDDWSFKGNKPVIIKFSAEWCGPCRMIAPILDEINTELDGKVDFYQVDIEDQYELASKFNIRSVPTVLFIPMEGDPKTNVGAMNKDGFKKIISDFLHVD